MHAARNGTAILVLLAGATVAGCAPGVLPMPSRPAAAVVVPTETGRGPKALKVPPGHYPRPGECRLWYAGRPPGHQPRSRPCGQLIGSVPPGAFVLYNGRAWDTDYDWRAREARKKGSVPAIILDLTLSLRR